MIRKLSILVLPALLAAGCGDDTGGTTTKDMVAPPDMTVLPDLGPPAAPAIGDQIDRMGRPAINTALTDPFNFDKMKDMVQDEYNKNGDPKTWMKYAPLLAGNLAVFDVLDGTCGNQALYDKMAGGANFLATGYVTFGGALADDELYLNTAEKKCAQYLAVELAFVTKLPFPDCGGRTPLYDVIDWSYGVLSGANVPVSDGVPKDEGMASSNDSFPFLGMPEL